MYVFLSFPILVPIVRSEADCPRETVVELGWGSDDFCRALVANRLPPNHVWAAARYCVPGLVAHQSAERAGERLEVPDFGDPPEHWELLNPDGR